MNTLPLQWSLDVNTLASKLEVSYEANPAELDALKLYAGLVNLTSFKAQVKVAQLAGGRFKASGTLQADIVQASVIDLNEVRSSVGESFDQEYWPAESIGERGGEAVAFDSDPPEPIVAGRIPIGAVLCEVFALSIDPYPRNEGDVFQYTPPEPEAETSPFAGLVHLLPQKSPGEE